MIITKIQGGLGNQIFQYVSGSNFAKRFNSPLYLDLKWFENGNREFHLNNFNINAKVLNSEICRLLTSNHLIKSRIFKSIYHKKIVDPVNELIDINSISQNTYFDGYWAYSLYYEQILESMKDELKIKPDKLSTNFQILKDKIESVNSAAIHIRRGDYIQYQSLFNLLTPQYYNQAIDLLNNRTENLQFFAFTDDAEWVKMNIQLPEKTIIVSNNYKLKDLEEFQLMRHCKHQIIANSTFSWWAAKLNNNENKMIVRPATWYLNHELQLQYEKEKLFYIRNSIVI